MSDLTALLLDAKAEYRLQMEEILTPSITQTICDLWSSSVQEGGSRDAIIVFQKALRDIPGWNATTISNKTREITYIYPYFEDLIAACIIAQLKIMSSIKLSQDKPTVQLKLPATDTFLHEVYSQTAKRIYENPFIMTTDTTIESALTPIVSDSIERTIRNLIPFKDILLAYLKSDPGAPGKTQQTSDTSSGSFPKRDDHSESESSEESDDEDVQVPYTEPRHVHVPPPPEVIYSGQQQYPVEPTRPLPPQQLQQPEPQLQPQPQPQQPPQHEYAAPLLGQEPKQPSLFSGDPQLRHGL